MKRRQRGWQVVSNGRAKKEKGLQGVCGAIGSHRKERGQEIEVEGKIGEVGGVADCPEVHRQHSMCKQTLTSRKLGEDLQHLRREAAVPLPQLCRAGAHWAIGVQ